MISISDVLNKRQREKDTRNTYEHQAFGNRLAEELGDSAHRSLYIKLAKTKDREMLEKAREFVLSQEHVYPKGKLFMWKLGQLEHPENKPAVGLDENTRKN